MSTSFKLSVSKPCSQDWNNMLPNDSGKHCTACATTVIDFSTMNDEQVASFFLLNNPQPVCGRFKASQIERIEIVVPPYFFQKRMALWKKYLLLLLVCFATEILPGNVLFNTNTGLYAQTIQTIKKKNAKNKRAHKRRKKIKAKQVKWDEVMILGFTQTIPEKTFQPNPEPEGAKPVENISQINLLPGNKNDMPGKRQKNTRWIYSAALIMRKRRKKHFLNEEKI